jgi:hypothetical protein
MKVIRKIRRWIVKVTARNTSRALTQMYGEFNPLTGRP